ncbi:MAG: YdcH family protein [Acidobacteria bacterium]|nr:YdcH family protein [Acidobacteriota bacterium]
MAEAQLSVDDTVRAVLLENHDEFRQLVLEHHRLDEHLRALATVPYLTEQQQVEEVALKKRKLALKDRIEHIVRHHAHGASSPQ